MSDAKTTVTVHTKGDERVTVKRDGAVVATLDGDVAPGGVEQAFDVPKDSAKFDIARAPLTKKMKAERQKE